MSVLESNLAILKKNYPDLSRRLDAFPDKECVRVFKARDGGVAYGIQKNGIVHPFTDPDKPLSRIQSQMDQWVNQLADYTRPVLVVGVYPGNELLCLFDRAEEDKTPHCPQPIWVCVDSTAGLCGFLKSRDVRRVLESSRVQWFWHTAMQSRVQWLREHSEFPHIFTLISGAADATLDRIMPPLAELVAQRQLEYDRLKVENELYYDAINDASLAEIIEGKGCRKPRLMMPTVVWSTYVQHSTRDTCSAFASMGWETSILKMDAMLTPYHLVKSINEFKPDVFLFIDHMRYEAEDIYPRNMMLLTWIQDDMSNLQCKRAGEKLVEYAARNKRDLVVGYVEGLDFKFGYPKDRLVPMPIPANSRIFHPVSLTNADLDKYGCDLAFMTNTSMPSEQVIERKILPQVESMGISRATCMQIHDDLWNLYRSERILINRQEFLDWLVQYREFKAAWNSVQSSALSVQKSGSNKEGQISCNSPAINTEHRTLNTEKEDDLFRLFFWRLNDTIYRHVVLEWADELGIDMKLYGQGWENHPRFARYAGGSLAHGPELNVAYQAARLNLHLNIAQGMHQRIHEIVASGGEMLIRTQQPPGPAAGEPPRELMCRVGNASRLQSGGSAETGPAFDLFCDDICESQAEKEALTDWVFRVACSMAKQDASENADSSVQRLERRLLEKIRFGLDMRIDWNLSNWEKHVFRDKQGFAQAIREIRR
jgi:hypothetical protein